MNRRHPRSYSRQSPARLLVALACAALPARGNAQASAVTPGAAPPALAHVFDVHAYGAKGDSTSLDTDAINRAIDAAAAARGGTVYFGPGIYSAFSIHLKSNVTLYLDHGATLLAASPAERPAAAGYDAAETGPANKFQDYGHSHWHNSLIWGENIENVTIEGPGRIDGSGLSRNISRDTPGAGNKAIALRLVRHVLLRDFSILRGGHFGILATGVDDMTIDNLVIDTNRDGIDVDDCRVVRIANTVVNSPNDDAIVLKTSYALGERRGTEDVVLTNSVVSGYDVGSVLDGSYRPFTEGGTNRDGPTGRVKLGTESNGPFRNITISNVVFDNCHGLALESVDGADLEDITIDNLTMRHVWTSPLFLRLGSRMRGPAGAPVGTFRRVTISNVIASDVDPRYASSITGIPGHPITDLRLSNIRILYRGGLTLEQAAAQPAEMVRTGPRSAGGAREAYAVPEMETAYPEPSMFGLLPAYGFYVRHVTGLVMDGVDIGVEKDDTRPALVLDDVRDAELEGVRAQKIANTPTLMLRNVDDVRLLHSRPIGDLQVRHATTKSY